MINAGAIAWSSQQILTLVKDVLENYEPDAIVVVSGNNELLEWFDARKYLPPDSLSRWVSSIKRARLLRKSRLYQWLNARIDDDAGRWDRPSSATTRRFLGRNEREWAMGIEPLRWILFVRTSLEFFRRPLPPMCPLFWEPFPSIG